MRVIFNLKYASFSFKYIGGCIYIYIGISAGTPTGVVFWKTEAHWAVSVGNWGGKKLCGSLYIEHTQGNCEESSAWIKSSQNASKVQWCVTNMWRKSDSELEKC